VIKAARAFALLTLMTGMALGHMSSAYGETYYRWVDDRGHPVHSDRPPPTGTEYEVVSTDSSLIREVVSEEGAVPPKIEPSASNEFIPVETGAPMIEKNPAYCERAKQNLWTLDNAARIRLPNEQGEMVYIDEEEKEAQRQKALKTIELNCE
jgi:hypothetical protein